MLCVRTSTAPLPLVPEEVLDRLHIHERDTRFARCSRVLAALWLQAQSIPFGVHHGRNGRPRRLGSRLSPAAAMAGRNFLSPAIARLAHQVLAYREPGAFLDPARTLGNALSSTALCLNAVGSLAGDLDLAARVLRRLLPDQDIDTVTTIRFEHSVQRRDPTLTNDGSAHDCCVWFTRKRRTRHKQRVGVLAMEWKLTESLHESAPCQPGKYDTLAEASGLFKEPLHAALRVNPLQQLFREHLLAQGAVMQGHWPSAVFVSVAPAMADRVQRQADLYRSFLNPPLEGQVPFQHLTLDAFVQAIGQEGRPEVAHALFDRYLDFAKVDRLVAEALAARVAKWPAATRKKRSVRALIEQAA
jgi:hypothetical protein